MPRGELGLFAGMRVSDLDRAVEWWSRLLGRDVAFRPNDVEAVYELADDRFVYVELSPEGAGHGLQTIVVDDFDDRIAGISERGIEPTKNETYSNGVRKATYHDPDGNEFGIGGPPSG